MSPEITEIATSKLGAEEQELARIWDITVEDAESFEQAGEAAKLVAAYINRVGEVMDPIISAAHNAHQVALRQRAGLLGQWPRRKAALSERMATWQREQECKRRVAEEAARLERERLEAQERARIAAEQERLRKAEEDRRIMEAVAAAEAGDIARAEQLVTAPVVTPPVTPRPVFVPPAAVAAPPKVAGISFRDNWTAVVDDLMALVQAVATGKQPITLLQANEVALNGLARSLRDAMNVPGVRAVNRPVMNTKA